MAQITKEILDQLAASCRLSLSSEEELAMIGEMQRVVSYVHLLDELDTKDISPYSHFSEQSIDSLREDIVVPENCLPTEEFLANAPEIVGGMIKVQTVMKQDS